MIRYFDGTIFNAETVGIVNTINIVGIMGNGIALEYALRYPKMFAEYKDKCERQELHLGQMYYYHAADGKIIINFPTKWHFKYPSKKEWVEKGLQDFVATYKSEGITSAAFPKLGCDLGHLSWKDVQPIMEKYLMPIDCDIVICENKTQGAEGKEAVMVDSYNKLVSGEKIVNTGLNKRQLKTLTEYGKIDRFWKIKEIKGVSVDTYKKLFSVFYNEEIGCEYSQMSLF